MKVVAEREAFAERSARSCFRSPPTHTTTSISSQTSLAHYIQEIVSDPTRCYFDIKKDRRQHQDCEPTAIGSTKTFHSVMAVSSGSDIVYG